jgi:hypothetical protein
LALFVPSAVRAADRPGSKRAAIVAMLFVVVLAIVTAIVAPPVPD